MSIPEIWKRDWLIVLHRHHVRSKGWRHEILKDATKAEAETYALAQAHQWQGDGIPAVTGTAIAIPYAVRYDLDFTLPPPLLPDTGPALRKAAAFLCVPAGAAIAAWTVPFVAWEWVLADLTEGERVAMLVMGLIGGIAGVGAGILLRSRNHD